MPFVESVVLDGYLIPGLIGTLQAAAISVVLAVIFGIAARHGSAVAAARRSGSLCGVFVEFFRAVPVLMMMFFAYYFGLFILKISRQRRCRCSASSSD